MNSMNNVPQDVRYNYRTETIDGRTVYTPLDAEGNPIRVGVCYMDGNGDPAVVTQMFTDGKPEYDTGPCVVYGRDALHPHEYQMAYSVLTPIDSPQFVNKWLKASAKERRRENRNFYFNSHDAWCAGFHAARSGKGVQGSPYYNGWQQWSDDE
jgi:hypothetical protein